MFDSTVLKTRASFGRHAPGRFKLCYYSEPLHLNHEGVRGERPVRPYCVNTDGVDERVVVLVLAPICCVSVSQCQVPRDKLVHQEKLL